LDDSNAAVQDAVQAVIAAGDFLPWAQFLTRRCFARIPPHIDSKTQWYCHGCGKTYIRQGKGPIPCESRCVYSEHAEHNKEYKKGKAWPADKTPLSWGTVETYKTKYKVDMPPTGKKYLELRAKYARKREREPETSA
jgi:hypothetical protein